MVKLRYCNFEAQAGLFLAARTITKHLLLGQRDRLLIASDVEEAFVPKATCLGGKALRARIMKTILNDATFILVYQCLKCCVARNYCLFNFLSTQRHSFLVK